MGLSVLPAPAQARALCTPWHHKFLNRLTASPACWRSLCLHGPLALVLSLGYSPSCGETAPLSWLCCQQFPAAPCPSLVRPHPLWLLRTMHGVTFAGIVKYEASQIKLCFDISKASSMTFICAEHLGKTLPLSQSATSQGTGAASTGTWASASFLPHVMPYSSSAWPSSCFSSPLLSLQVRTSSKHLYFCFGTK